MKTAAPVAAENIVPTAANTEKTSPIREDTIKAALPKTIRITDRMPRVGSKYSFRTALTEREIGISSSHFGRFFRSISNTYLGRGFGLFSNRFYRFFAHTNILIVIVPSLLIGGYFAFFHGCSSFRLASCSSVVEEHISKLGTDGAGFVPLPGEHSPPPENYKAQFHSERQIRETSIVDRPTINFDIPTFSSVLVVVAFIFGFFKWQVENRQSSIAHLFERKKEINLLIMNDVDLQFLAKGATDPENVAHPIDEAIVLSAADGLTIINSIQENSHITKDRKPFTGKEKIFAFLEMDNLEFALENFLYGYLDVEQMYRACEIFESRCLSNDFRYLAATQGLAYYNLNFRRLLCMALIRGYKKSTVATK